MKIIIGTGLAGYNTAKQFRLHDPESPLMLISTEAGRFYSKPMLSTGFSQQKNADALTIATAEKMRESLPAEILVDTAVTSIDPQAQTITTAASTYDYEQLILATGSQPLRTPFPIENEQNIFQVNNIAQYQDFLDSLAGAKDITIVGSGLVGCEFANDLSKAGYNINVISREAYPLARFLPEVAGQALAGAFAENNINCYYEDQVNEITGTDVLTLKLASGTDLKADRVLIAIGIQPNTALATAAKLDVDNGIKVDEYLQTSDPNIFALGDCANVCGYSLQYVMPLMNAARALGATMSGTKTAVSYPSMPVIAKTSYCPVRLVLPAAGVSGSWQTLQADGPNTISHFIANDGSLQGYALTGYTIKQGASLGKDLPGWL